MKISVIIPVRNLSTKLIKCFDSIAIQDFSKSEYEVLVIFDSCTDDSERIAVAWKELHSDVNMHFFLLFVWMPRRSSKYWVR